MDWDDAYANAPYIPGGADYPARWEAEADQFRRLEEALGRAALNQSYGTGERERFDLFYPAGKPAGLVVFLHGGYWRAFGRESWSHLAKGPAGRGWVVAIPSYTLAPHARIAEISRQAVRAIEAAASRVAGPLVLTGHSAGGHLAARALAPELALAPRVARVVPISPLSDLRPLLALAMNADWRMDAAEAEAESPMLQSPPAAEAHVWVGAAERPAFLDQARWLSEAWNARLTIEPGRHHFDVVEGLASPDSALTEALLGGM
jgi:acetyl esterase/lipase